MRVILSNHHLLISLETQELAYKLYKFVKETKLITNPEINNAVDFSVDYYDEFKKLPDSITLQEKGFIPKPEPCTLEAVLYRIQLVWGELKNRSIKKRAIELASIDDLDELRKAFSNLQLDVTKIAGEIKQTSDVMHISYEEAIKAPEYSTPGAMTNIRELDNITYGFHPATLVVAMAGRSMGKCLKGDQLINTTGGIFSIEEMKDQDVYIRSMNGIEKVNEFYNLGEKLAYIIDTNSGHQFVCSGEHKWLILTPNFKLDWKCSKELTTQDFLIKVTTNIPCGNFSFGEVDLYYLIGLIQGDGYIAKDDSIALVISSRNLCCEFWIELFNKYIGYCGGSRSDKQILLRKKNFHLFSKFFENSGRVSYDKKVPLAVRTSKRILIAAYLQGLFDTDGWVELNCVRINLSNELFIRQIDALLSIFGIHTSIRVKKTTKRNSWGILIRSSSINVFRREIGFRDPIKKAKLDKIKVSERYHSIPYCKSWVRELFLNLGGPREVRKYFKFSEPKSNWECTFESLRYFVENFTDEVSDVAKFLVENGCYLDRVSSVSIDESVVMYDLTIEGSHSYNVSGYLTHNSTFIDNFTYVNAVQNGFNILYISLEIPKQTLYFRFLSRHSYQLDQTTAISYVSVKNNILTDEQKQHLIKVEKDFREKMKGSIRILDISDGINFGPDEFRAMLEKEYKEKPYDILILDYIQLIKYAVVRGMSDMELMNKVIAVIREKTVSIGDGHKILAMVLSQANREGIEKAKKNQGAYTLNALAEVNELERSAQIVLAFYMDDILRSSGEIKYQMLKNREGTLISTPQVTFIDPPYCMVGETAVYNEVFSESSLSMIDGVSDFIDKAFDDGTVF